MPNRPSHSLASKSHRWITPRLPNIVPPERVRLSGEQQRADARAELTRLVEAHKGEPWWARVKYRERILALSLAQNRGAMYDEENERKASRSVWLWCLPKALAKKVALLWPR